MTTHWRDVPAFAGVDLEDSRVLGWTLTGPPYRLTVLLDACVLPPPNAPTRAPTRGPARIVFDDVRAAVGLAPPGWPPPSPGDAPPPLDTLAGLRREPDGAWRFDLRWGEARVECGAVSLHHGADS